MTETEIEITEKQTYLRAQLAHYYETANAELHMLRNSTGFFTWLTNPELQEQIEQTAMYVNWLRKCMNEEGLIQ